MPAELEEQNISRDSGRISPDPNKVTPEFLRLILESPDVQGEIRRTTTGLAVKGINVGRIRQLKVPNWSLSQQREAVEDHRLIERALAAVEKELATLSVLQGSLSSDVFGDP